MVLNAKQGWEPLCKFLGKPVPEGPYPRAPNVTKTMRKSDSNVALDYRKNDVINSERLYIASEVFLSISFIAIYGGLGYTIYTGRAQSLFLQYYQSIQAAAKQYLF